MEDFNAVVETSHETSDTVDVKGCFLRFTGPNAVGLFAQVFRIEDCTANTLTLDATLTSLPPVGTPYIIGRIESRARTPLMDLGDVKRRKRALALALE